MFDVSTEETTELAVRSGLCKVLHCARQPSALRRDELTWTKLAFRKGA